MGYIVERDAHQGGRPRAGGRSTVWRGVILRAVADADRGGVPPNLPRRDACPPFAGRIWRNYAPCDIQIEAV
jgi:hypothetical protein